MPCIAAFLFALLDAPHGDERLPPRFGRGQASGDVLSGELLDMALQLLVEITVET